MSNPFGLQNASKPTNTSKQKCSKSPLIARDPNILRIIAKLIHNKKIYNLLTIQIFHTMYWKLNMCWYDLSARLWRNEPYNDMAAFLEEIGADFCHLIMHQILLLPPSWPILIGFLLFKMHSKALFISFRMQ